MDQYGDTIYSVISYSIFQPSSLKTPEAPSCLTFTNSHSEIMDSDADITLILLGWTGLESLQLSDALLWNFALDRHDYHKLFFFQTIKQLMIKSETGNLQFLRNNLQANDIQ